MCSLPSLRTRWGLRNMQRWSQCQPTLVDREGCHTAFLEQGTNTTVCCATEPSLKKSSLADFSAKVRLADKCPAGHTLILCQASATARTSWRTGVWRGNSGLNAMA